jgi:hypothetical protein
MMILLTGAVFVVSHPQAVSAAEATADAEAKEDSAAEDAEKPASDKSANNSEVFIPTEEISEDFAVSFPVDI